MLKIVAFEKVCTFSIENEDFIVFSKFKGILFNIQNGGVRGLSRILNFDLQIAFTSSFYIRF